MLDKKSILKIREFLEKSQNPLFFFDNDADGLCSFLLLQRYLERGKGVAIKSHPDLSEDYFRKVNELDADAIIILDKPVVSEEFLIRAHEKNMPVLWIDHHPPEQEIPKYVDYYNPIIMKNGENTPVTRMCYQVSEKKDDMWLAVAGCIADKHLPDFYGEFEKKYPELAVDSDDPFVVKYESDIGKISQMLDFGLKDRTSNVISMMKFLMKVKFPSEILAESSKNKLMHLKYNQIDSRRKALISKARELAKKPGIVLFFRFGGDLSISSELSNELMHRYPNKLVVVAYANGYKANISMRGDNARAILLKVIDKFEDSTGGGHEKAVGARVKTEDLDRFREEVEKVVLKEF